MKTNETATFPAQPLMTGKPRITSAIVENDFLSTLTVKSMIQEGGWTEGEPLSGSEDVVVIPRKKDEDLYINMGVEFTSPSHSEVTKFVLKFMVPEYYASDELTFCIVFSADPRSCLELDVDVIFVPDPRFPDEYMFAKCDSWELFRRPIDPSCSKPA